MYTYIGTRFLSKPYLLANLMHWIPCVPPSGNLFVFAICDSIVLNYKTKKVVREFRVIPGEPRNYPSTGSSVMLPLLASDSYGVLEVLVCGGSKGMRKSCFKWDLYSSQLWNGVGFIVFRTATLTYKGRPENSMLHCSWFASIRSIQLKLVVGNRLFTERFEAKMGLKWINCTVWELFDRSATVSVGFGWVVCYRHLLHGNYQFRVCNSGRKVGVQVNL